MISPPSADALREAAAKIVAGPDYQLDSPASHESWTEEVLYTILEWIAIPVRWLFRMTEGLPDFLRWFIVVSLVLVVIVLIWHMTYSFLVALRRPTRQTYSGPADRQLGFSPEELEQLAEEAAREGDFISSIRFLFRASVIRLELSSRQKHRPGTTNRDLLRRFSKWPELSTSIRHFVDVIDRKWFGDEVCLERDWMECRLAYDSVCSFLRERGHALST
jgi:hypothetical protein